MNNLPRQKLKEIVASYDQDVYLDPRRCRGLLLDLCGEYRREVNILITVLEEQIVADLLNLSGSVSYVILYARLVKRLYENRGLPEEFAGWGVESWALALGNLALGEIPPTPPAASGTSNANQENPSPEWYIIGKSVRGTAHTVSEAPNQDAILWEQNPEGGIPLVLAIADGQGSDRSFRSKIGAQMAVQAANEVMYRFAKENSNQSLSVIEATTKRLPSEIVLKWKELVEQHWNSTSLNEKEWQWLSRKQNADAWKTITANHAILYGATLLIALVTGSFTLYYRLGDGDILTVSVLGEVSEPIPSDERTLFNETASLCDAEAAQDFRMYLQKLEGPKPALIMLSTDGYSNSFPERSGFHKAGSDFWKILYSSGNPGLKAIEEGLEGWLTSTSKKGSGDDITVGLLCRMSALMSGTNQEIDTISPALNRKGNIPAGQSTNTEEAGKDQTSPFTRSVPSGHEETISPLVQPQPTQASGVQELPKAIRSQKRELIVSQNGGGDYTTINDAIRAARRDARILVQRGSYHEKLILEKPLEIVGNGPQVIIENNTSVCIRMKAKHATLSGLILRGNPAVEILTGQLVLQNCEITSELSHGVVITTEGATPILKDCNIHDVNGSGVVLYNKAQGIIVDCNIFNNNAAGVEIRQGTLAISGSQIYNNKGSGVLIRDHSKCEIKHCNISGNIGAGLEIKQYAKIITVKCNISKGKGSGVLIYDHGCAKMRSCDVFGNTSAGIEVKEQGSLTISGSKIHDEKRNGVLFHKNGAGTLLNCDIFANTLAGIKIQEGDQDIIAQGCTVHDGRSCGILIFHKIQDADQVNQDKNDLHQSRVKVTNCHILENSQAGIEIRNYSNPIIQNCIISRGKRNGILVCNHSRGVIEDCHISENTLFGVAIKENAQPTIKNCTINYNAYQGVLVSGKSRVTLEKNCTLTPNTRGKFYKEAGCQVEPKRGIVDLFSRLLKRICA